MEDIYLSYDFLGAGELDLADKKDMVTMFRFLEESQTSRVHIHVRRKNGILRNEVCVAGSSGISEIGECSGAVVDEVSRTLAMEVMPERELSNDEWRLLITGPGQRFPDGALKFQRALIKYFVQMGFEFVFLNNGRTRVTAACMFRVEKGCFWRIHAVEDKADESFYISLYERNHTCGTSFGTVSKKRINHQI